MGLFNNEAKEMKEQFKAQMNRQDEANETQVAMQMSERGAVAFEPQVSQLVLECNRRFLPWKPDYKNNTLTLPDKYVGLQEPFNEDDSKSFLTDEEKLLLYDVDETLAEIFGYGDKYGFDDKILRLFNNIVFFRWSLLSGSRTTGKSVKAAKSQYVESSSFIKRGVDKDGRSGKFLGLF